MRASWLNFPLKGFLLACLASAVVSILLDGFSFPAAWLTGGLLGTAFVVSRRVIVRLPPTAINLSYLTLGALFGSAITVDIASQMATWAGTLILCCLSLAATMIASTWYMRRFEHWDMPTSFFATAPGALPAVIALSEEFRLDQGRVILSQTVRLFSIMAFAPLVFSAAPNASGSVVIAQSTMNGLELALISAIAVAGGIIARMTRMPGGLMIGALLACGIVYATGFLDTALPIPIQNTAMMVIGMLVGVQLVGLQMANVMRSARAVLVVLALGIVVAVITSMVASWFFVLPFEQVLLSYLPGAMEGMTVLGFVLGYDPAFISVHHVARFLFVLAALPIVSRAWRS